MNKYILTKNTKQWLDHTLYQIQATKDFGSVKAGELGGWVEKESNLSQEGLCWVYWDALVYENARVYGNAQVFGDAQVSGNAQVYEKARVYGDARVYGNAQVFANCTKTPIVITGLQWPVSILDTHMKIGCQEHSLSDWASFSKSEIKQMSEKALAFCETFGALLLSIREVV